MPSDVDRLQGTWKIMSVELDGRAMPETAIGDSRIVVEGHQFTSLSMGATYEGTVALDEDRSPKTIDLLFTAGPEQGRRNLGIYALEGKRWTICLATRGNRRPTRFATRPGTGIALQTLERAAATVRRRSKASAPERIPRKRSSAAAPPTILEGEWSMVSAVFDGAPLDKAMVKWCRRVTAGDVTTVLAGPQVMLKARFTIDPAKSPREIDYVNLAGSHRAKAQAGIFELARDTLQICMAAPGAARPADFASNRGDGRSYTVWRKERT